jgi:cytochrome bd-type quinol oxidase subunit 2
MSSFRKALLWTAIPIVVLSFISMAGVAGGPTWGGTGGMGVLAVVWFFAALYFVGAIIALIVYAIRRKRQIAAGILAGLGIGIVALGATCFVNS